MGSSPDETTHLIHSDPSSPDELNALLAAWELYRIEALVGEGGMARVYKAYDPKLKRYVALKFIRTDDENLKKRLLREAQAQAQIDHDHVCKIYEVGVVEGKSYIAMQLVKGGTFRELSQEMSLEQKVLLLMQVCEAVQAAHSVGIIHRDIKPTNIMVERKEGGAFTPYIMDFGIAREIAEPGLTATEVVMGTPAFMAPEQMLGDSNKVDRRADIYSLGSTMYYAFAGLSPFQGSGVDLLVQLATQDPVPIKKRIASIPEDLEIIVSKCLERDPSRRYDSARALADDLKRYLDGEPILAKRAAWRYRVVKKIRKHKTIAAISTLATLLIVALAGLSIFSYLRVIRQVEIARQFSKSVEEMDWIMRVAHMAPLHDIRKEQTQVLQRMKQIESMMKNAGDAGLGPGNFALGRGYLTLQNYEMARLHLTKAWDSGYKEKEVASALGITLGALYKRKLSEIDRIADRETRDRQMHIVEKEYRDPAFRFLSEGSEIGSASREYGQALLSYFENKWNDSLRLARLTGEKFPWLYEAKMLEGDVYSRLGEEAFAKGDYDVAMKQFQAGADSYTQAENTSRSDPALYESHCSLMRAMMEAQFAKGIDSRTSYEQSKAYCKKALAANSESATAYGLLAQSSWRWAESQFQLGEDPTQSFLTSIEMSRQAQKLDPESAYAYYTMGTAYSYLADYESGKGKDPTESLNRAIQVLTIAAEKDPGYASTYTNLGVSYFSQGSLAMSRGEDSKGYFLKAIDAYQKALRVSPKNIAARANIANAFDNLGKAATIEGADPSTYFEQSIKNYKEALELNPNHWLIHNNLSTVYLDQMRYDLDHGNDLTETYQKAIAECQKTNELKPDNIYASINSADSNVYYAEYMMLKNENPLPWIAKAELIVSHVIDSDFEEASLALADAARIEAEYRLMKGNSPLAAIEKSKGYLDRTLKINSEEVLVPIGYARLELIRAKWQALRNQSPEGSLTIAQKQAWKALELNSKSADAYLILGEMNLLKSLWKESHKMNPANDLQEGFSALEKALHIKPDLADAYVTKAKLLLVNARFKSDPAERARIAAESAKNFERAFEINALLKGEEKDSFQQANLLAQNQIPLSQ